MKMASFLSFMNLRKNGAWTRDNGVRRKKNLQKQLNLEKVVAQLLEMAKMVGGG